MIPHGPLPKRLGEVSLCNQCFSEQLHHSVFCSTSSGKCDAQHSSFLHFLSKTRLSLRSLTSSRTLYFLSNSLIPLGYPTSLISLHTLDFHSPPHSRLPLDFHSYNVYSNCTLDFPLNTLLPSMFNFPQTLDFLSLLSTRTLDFLRIPNFRRHPNFPSTSQLLSNFNFTEYPASLNTQFLLYLTSVLSLN